MFDHIKSKVVKAAKAPERNDEQCSNLPIRVPEKQRYARCKPKDKKQKALKFYPARICQVFHND
jgi:hypothetical protein